MERGGEKKTRRRNTLIARRKTRNQDIQNGRNTHFNRFHIKTQLSKVKRNRFKIIDLPKLKMIESTEWIERGVSIERSTNKSEEE